MLRHNKNVHVDVKEDKEDDSDDEFCAMPDMGWDDASEHAQSDELGQAPYVRFRDGALSDAARIAHFEDAIRYR